MRVSVCGLICLFWTFGIILASPQCSVMFKQIEGYTYRCETNETLFYGTFNESEILNLFCERFAMGVGDIRPEDSESLPIFHPVMIFQNINLFSCIPAVSDSYADTFAIMNIDPSVDRLELRFKQNITLHPHYFTGLQLRSFLVTIDFYDDVHFDAQILQELENLTDFYISGMVVQPMPEGNKIKAITIIDGKPSRFLQPWGDCTYLEELNLKYWHVEVLPDGWLANCSRLHHLRLRKLDLLRRLPSRLLEGVHSLRSLTVSGSQMEVLPADLLSYTKELRFLDLSDNNLISLPSGGIFSSLSSLEVLDLSLNNICVLVVAEFAPLVSLQSLTIDNLKEIDNFNESAVVWPLLPSLKRLSMRDSHVTKISPKWYETMPALKEINLNGNKITNLKYQDMKQIHAKGWNVSLQENPLDAILFDQSDYDAALADNNQVQSVSDLATLWIDSPIHCDCRWYWFMKLLQEVPTYVSLPGLRCSHLWGKIEEPKPVKNLSLRELMCQLPESDCTPGCSCYRREPDNTTFVNCTDAGVKQIPHIGNSEEIHLANNYIATIQAADLPSSLTFLDLTFNRLARVDAETATKMFAMGSRSYRLAGNPIICDCSNRAMIEALHRNSKLVVDYENVTCVNKQTVGAVDIDRLCLAEHLTLIAGVIGTLAILAVLLFTLYYRYRREVQVILRNWGCCVSDKDLDCDKVYDVFISFAYGDTDFITDELVPKLEREPFNLKVCVHYRDWIVGEWIPMQIARSVEESRHTMIVLSENFLSSVWAPLEFRTAHKKALKDRCSRLVIVLLEDVIGDQRIDQELRAYLTTNTYIKRDDPRFWEKLQHVLPHKQCNVHKSCKDRIAGEEVVQRIRVNDPPIRVRND